MGCHLSSPLNAALKVLWSGSLFDAGKRPSCRRLQSNERIRRRGRDVVPRLLWAGCIGRIQMIPNATFKTLIDRGRAAGRRSVPPIQSTPAAAVSHDPGFAHVGAAVLPPCS